MPENKRLKLKIVKPDEAAKEYECFSVRFFVPPAADGSGGGWLGVRPGHARMLAAVAPGDILAFDHEGAEPVRIACSRGFVSVENDIVSVITI